MSGAGYLTGIHLAKTWTHENVDIQFPPPEGRKFQHLILIGRNGSGKTVTLEGLTKTLSDPIYVALGPNSYPTPFPVQPLGNSERLRHLYVPAMRRFQGQPVSGPAAQDLKSLKRHPGLDSASFVQYLVNQRTEQAYAREEGDNARADRLAQWFARVEQDLSELLGATFTLVFKRQPQFSFALADADGRESPFESLPSGWSALLGVFSALLLNYAAHGEDPTSDTPVVLVIDEPEVHLHPALQWTVLPTLSRLFPAVQIVAATQSPIVAASLQHAVVYDLSNQQAVPNVYGGPPESVMLRAFDAATRPDDVATRLRELERVVDSEDWSRANVQLEAFSSVVGEDDPDVIRLRALVRLSQALDSAG